MTLPKDETRVLRDAYRLDRMGTDYSEDEAWERPIVDRLVATGLLQRSCIGRLLSIRSFRLTASGLVVAARHHREFEARLSDEIAAFV